MSTKYPSEIFGHPYYSQTAEAIEDRQKHWCPSIETFHQSLQTKMKKQAQISLQFKPPSGSTNFDLDPPTATGIVRERSDIEQKLMENKT